MLLAGGGVAYVASSTVEKFSTTISNVFQTPVLVRPPITLNQNETDPNSDTGTSNTIPPDVTTIPITHVFPDWSKKEPVNILLLGLDYRPQEEDTRADTQIIVHIDPAANTVSMLSIPRDLWVQVPGYGESRINAAFQQGDHDNRVRPGSVPGGGPGLSMSTIEANFGISIDYFAQVDFTGFEKVVDSMGGLTLDVPRPLADNSYPLSATSYGETRIYIPAGLQHMDGHTALEYARSRHADNDLGRNSRQQQVLLALRQQGMNLNIISKLGSLADQLSGAVRTDLNFVQLGSLAQLAKNIDQESITTCQFDETMAHQAVLPSGAEVLLPTWTVIRPKIMQCFADPKLAKEAARISVKNGTATAGTGRKVRDILVARGLFVPDLSSVQNPSKHPTTTIVDYTGGQKPLTVAKLKSALNLGDTAVVEGNPAEAPLANTTDGKPLDIVVIAGDDRLAGK